MKFTVYAKEHSDHTESVFLALCGRLPFPEPDSLEFFHIRLRSHPAASADHGDSSDTARLYINWVNEIGFSRSLWPPHLVIDHKGAEAFLSRRGWQKLSPWGWTPPQALCRRCPQSISCALKGRTH